MEIVNAYELVGSDRGAAQLCGTTHKTVKRVLERRDVGEARRRVSGTNTAGVQALIAERVRASDGRISANTVAADRSGSWLLWIGAQSTTCRGRCQNRVEAQAAQLSAVGADAWRAPGD